MSTAERMYENYPRERWCGPSVRIHPAWIVLLILGFIVWWPVGLAILAFTFWSRKMSCHSGDHWERKMQRLEEKLAHVRELRERFGGAFGGGNWGGGGWGGGSGRSSGNHAFDEYRAETLRRLEEEQREFKDFLNRLRFAKDKTEFDQFMAERRNRPQPPEPPQPQS
ncbi:MAG: DUF2852 domain-containing protein [Alphaproteobacteria bacterium]|nr:DUF2852 domain-containing protein [Alphaproteobacteria bacterium]